MDAFGRSAGRIAFASCSGRAVKPRLRSRRSRPLYRRQLLEPMPGAAGASTQGQGGVPWRFRRGIRGGSKPAAKPQETAQAVALRDRGPDSPGQRFPPLLLPRIHAGRRCPPASTASLIRIQIFLAQQVRRSRVTPESSVCRTASVANTVLAYRKRTHEGKHQHPTAARPSASKGVRVPGEVSHRPHRA